MFDKLTILFRAWPGRENSFAMVGRFILLAVFALTVSPVCGQPTGFLDTRFWIPDGPVNAILVTNNTVYLGGDFSYVGPRTGPVALFDQATGQRLATPPIIAGVVRAVQPDEKGGWFIGGSFTNIGGAAITNLARLNPDLSLDTVWNPGLLGTAVNALALTNGRLYVGGTFYRIGGQVISGLAAVSAKDASLTSWNPQFSGSVNAMRLAGDLLYVGGSFYSVGNSNRANLAAIATDTALANAWDPQADSQVLAIEVSGNTVYVGGQFTTSVGTKPRNRLAALDATTGVATSWNPNPNGIVRALAVSGTAVYAGGDFTTIGGKNRRGFAAVSTGNGAAQTLDLQLVSPSTASLVRSISIQGNALYVGGSFTNALGVVHRALVGLDLTSSLSIPTPLATDFNGQVGAAFGANALAIASGKILVGGDFQSFGGVARMRAAALSKTTGEALPWAPGFDAPVLSLAYSTNGVYVGGSFTNLLTTNPVPTQAGGLALVDPVTGNPGSFKFLGSNSYDAAFYVSALAVTSNAVFAGGSFAAVSGQPRRYLAALDPLSGDLLTAFNANLAGGYAGVNSLVLAGSTLYAAGDFYTVNGAIIPRLAALLPDTGAAIDWKPTPNQSVTVLAASSDTLYVGGLFTTIAGTAFRNFAAFSLADNSLAGVDASLDTSAYGVNAISATPTTLYVAGSFSAIGGEFRKNLACLASFNASSYDWNPAPDVSPTVITLTDDLAFVGGPFRYLGNYPTNVVNGFLAVFSRAPTILSASLTATKSFRLVTTTGDRTDSVLQATPSLSNPAWTNMATNDTPGFVWTNDFPIASPASKQFFRTIAR